MKATSTPALGRGSDLFREKDMNKLFTLAILASLGAAAQASINLNINQQYQTVAVPSSGSINVVFSGTIQILQPNVDFNSAALESPASGSGPFIGTSFDSGFLAYLSQNAPGVGYSGNLFSVVVTSSTAPDFYWLNNGSAGISPLAEFIVIGGVNGASDVKDNELFGVNVVPEPATLAALGLGAAALIRRKRSK